MEQALAKGVGADVLKELMSLQERYERNQARRAFDQAISAAKSEIRPVVKTRAGHNGKYEDLAAIAEAVDPILSKHGLSYRFRTSQANNIITVTCVLSHFGYSEETSLSAPADNTGNKNAIQAIGSACSYLQRYTLKSALGLAAARDDDGVAAGKPQQTGELLPPKQLEAIKDLITQTGANEPKFCAFMRVASITDLTAAQYAPAVQALQKFAAQKAGRQ